MYKWNAEDYNQHSSEMRKWGKELISKIRLTGNERVLDIGCGDGKVTADIAKQVPQGLVLGIDSSPDMIDLARRLFPPATFPHLRFQAMDARELSFDSEFDVVFSNATLHWVKDHLPVLRGIRRSLKPSGRILLQMGGRGNITESLEVMHRVISCDRWKPCFADFPFPWGFHGPEEYKAWLEQAGLVAQRVELIPKTMGHQGRGELEGWFRVTWLPYIQRVPAERQEEFLREVTDAYLVDHPADSRGIIEVQVVRLEVEAIAN